MLVMSDSKVEWLVESCGDFSFKIPCLVLFFLFHDISHSRLEYGMGVIGLKKYLVNQIYGWVVRESPWLCWILHMLIRTIFLLYFISICTYYYVGLMAILSLLLFWLYASYKHGFMIDSSYGSYHVLIGKWMVI